MRTGKRKKSTSKMKSTSPKKSILRQVSSPKRGTEIMQILSTRLKRQIQTPFSENKRPSFPGKEKEMTERSVLSWILKTQNSTNVAHSAKILLKNESTSLRLLKAPVIIL